MKNTILTLCLIAMAIMSFGQDAPPKYFDLVNKADSLFLNKEYYSSGLTYSSAFKIFECKGCHLNRYNAAKSWTLAGINDSAFVNIERINNEGGFAKYNPLITDTTFNRLHFDKRWQPLIDNINKQIEKEETKLNKPVMSQLDSIFDDDQKYRLLIDSIENKFGKESKELKDLWKIISEKDSVNLIKVTTILDKYGWLGADVIGRKGNSTLFLVIQHSDLKTQEKYKPMMEEAVKKGNARASSYALLVDRIEMGNNRPQIYGSQVQGNITDGYKVYPIIDEINVNKRRAEVGLETLEEYLGHFNIVYKLPKK